ANAGHADAGIERPETVRSEGSGEFLLTPPPSHLSNKSYAAFTDFSFFFLPLRIERGRAAREGNARIAYAQQPQTEGFARMLQAEHDVEKLEYPEARAHADIAEYVAGEQRGHRFLHAKWIAGVQHQAAHAGRVEAPDEPGEDFHAAVNHALEIPELRFRRGIISQQGIDCLGAPDAAAHAQQHAAGKDRIHEGVGIAHHDVAFAAHARGLVGIVARRARFVVDQLGVSQAVTHLRVSQRDRLQQKLRRTVLALLEVFGAAYRAHAHTAVLEGNHPEPAVLEPVHADIARVFSFAPVHLEEVAEYRGAGVMRVLLLEVELL